MFVKNLFFLIIISTLFCGYTVFQESQEVKSGKELYRNCSGCHLADGNGVKGFYPPHVKHIPDLIKVKGGREYIINVVLYGLKGTICVDDDVYNKGIAMPTWGGTLNDKQIADVLNYTAVDLGNNKKYLPKGFKPFSSKEVNAMRKVKLTDEQVYKQRIKIFGEPCK